MITVHKKVMETSQSFPARKKEASVLDNEVVPPA